MAKYAWFFGFDICAIQDNSVSYLPNGLVLMEPSGDTDPRPVSSLTNIWVGDTISFFVVDISDQSTPCQVIQAFVSFRNAQCGRSDCYPFDDSEPVLLRDGARISPQFIDRSASLRVSAGSLRMGFGTGPSPMFDSKGKEFRLWEMLPDLSIKEPGRFLFDVGLTVELPSGSAGQQSVLREFSVDPEMIIGGATDSY